MCLDFGEVVAPTTSNDTASLEEMHRALDIHANVKKMCKKFNQSMVLGMHWTMYN